MKHPTPDEWMAYLYHESDSARRAELQVHARNCAECAARLRAWSAGKEALDDWPARVGKRAPAARLHFLKLAAAAVLVLGVGLAIGRGLHQGSPELAGFKRDILNEFDRRLATAVESSGAEMRRAVANLAQAQTEQRAVDREAIIGALQQLETRYAAQVASLRAALETVALNTEDGLIETHQRMGLLVSSSAPANSPPQ